MPKKRNHEDKEQAALFEWAAFEQANHPELRWMYAIPNGGKRDKGTGKLLKKTGVKGGVSDICLPVKRNVFSGLYLEMKTPENKALKIRKGVVSKEQLEFGEFVTGQGYLFVVAYGWESAAETITSYLAQ